MFATTAIRLKVLGALITRVILVVQNFIEFFVVNCYGGTGRIIVFSSTKADCNSFLTSDQISHDVEVMHGDIA